MSIGVATLPIHADSAEDLVAKADRALYAAKARGKDSVLSPAAGRRRPRRRSRTSPAQGLSPRQ